MIIVYSGPGCADYGYNNNGLCVVRMLAMESSVQLSRGEAVRGASGDASVFS